jgi:hypothetical protein
MKWFRLILYVIIFFISLKANSLDFTNRLSLYILQTAHNTEIKPDIDFLWLANVDLNILRNSIYDAKTYISLQNRLSVPYQSKASHAVNLYRCWVRVGSMQTSLRLGLQQLNFGSAQLYRPLQWFDNLNPLDLVDQTKGVEAVLLRHFFDDRGNIWLWGIRGNDEVKGLEFFSSEKNSIESGGRIQFPISESETAFTFHSRKVKLVESNKSIREYRFGLDMRTDSIFGFWLETAGSYIENEETFSANLQAMATFGLDYTFSWGNGLYVLTENAFIVFGKTDSWRNDAVLSALMLDYPLSMLDKISLFNQYEWKEKVSVHTLIFRRTYDHLSFQINLTHDFGSNKTDSIKYTQITVNYDI